MVSLSTEKPPGTDLVTNRIQSLDILRGLVMVLMALDHVRDFFHAGAQVQDPMDLNTTFPALYFTRWITHFCAPTFVFLSGISAFLSGNRKSKAELSVFLFTRGLWLIFLEVTVVSFGWSFDFQFRTFLFQVIWAIGFSMVLLSGLVYLPRIINLALALLLIFGHNILDILSLTGNSWEDFVWAGLHQFRVFQVSSNLNLIIAYPVLPWLGLMILGFYFGRFYKPDTLSKSRQKLFLFICLTCLFLFLVLRFIQGYGDVQEFEQQPTKLQSVYDFFNTTKYPPSLHFILMTIGPALMALIAFEKIRNKITDYLVTLGSVPLFYYLVHIYLIHGLAMVAAFSSGYSWQDFEPAAFIGMPKDFGFSLPVVYMVWIMVVLILYPLCHWYAHYKGRNRHKKWLSYL